MPPSHDERTAARFGQLPFEWVYEGQPDDSTTPTGTDASQTAPAKTKAPPPTASTSNEPQVRNTTPTPAKARRSLRETVERYLREKHIPYINVDEAKKALFAGARLRSFHFVVYFSDRRNWLLYTSQLRQESRDDLKQWEAIFGDGFVAVVGKQNAKGELMFKTLAGEALELP